MARSFGAIVMDEEVVVEMRTLRDEVTQYKVLVQELTEHLTVNQYRQNLLFGVAGFVLTCSMIWLVARI